MLATSVTACFIFCRRERNVPLSFSSTISPINRIAACNRNAPENIETENTEHNKSVHGKRCFPDHSQRGEKGRQHHQMTEKPESSY
ncbi:hypothetical protein ES705_15803 [subsurface metagenome]